MRIQKTIYQTCPTKHELNNLFLENIEKIKRINPDWNHQLFDSEDRRKFILEQYGIDYLNSYDSIHSDYGAAKADFFRYLLIYKLGGVYIDLKSTTHLPLSSVIKEDDRYILSHWDNADNGKHAGAGIWPKYGVSNEFQQWHVISEAGHPYLRKVIDIVKNNIDQYNPFHFGIGRIGTLRTTGPIPYTLAINSVSQANLHRLVKIEELGIQYSILENNENLHRALTGSRYATSKAFIKDVSLPMKFGYKTLTFIKSILKQVETWSIRPIGKFIKNFRK